MSGFRQVSKAQAKTHLSRDERVARLDGAVVQFSNRAEYQHEISRLWENAQDTFVTIGRYLLAAAASLPHGEFDVMVENGLPFGRQIAYQLRKVAEAIDGGRFPPEQLPPSYTTIFQLTTLTDPQLSVAKERGLLRPDVTRREIITFRREVAREAGAAATPAQLAGLAKRGETLLKQRDKILRELMEVERAMSDLGLLADGEPLLPPRGDNT